MNWDQSVITVISIFVAFSMVILSTPVIWRARNNLDGRSIAFWVLGWCIGLGSSFLNDDVYLFVGRVSRIPNINWLLSFSVAMAGVYSLIILTSETLQIEPSQVKRLAYITVVFIVLLTLVFFLGGIAFSPPNLVRADANSLAELVFMNISYLYQMVVLSIPWALSARMLVRSRSLESRIRSGTFFVVLSSAILYCILRITKTIVVFYASNVNETLINSIQIALWFSFATTLFLWPITFVPTRWFEFFRQIDCLIHLNYLYRRIREGYSQTPRVLLPRLWIQARQVEFYTNVISVFVLDVKWLDSQDRLSLDDESVAVALRNLDDTLPQKQFVVECVEQSRNLRTREKLRMRKVEIESHDQAVSQAT